MELLNTRVMTMPLSSRLERRIRKIEKLGPKPRQQITQLIDTFVDIATIEQLMDVERLPTNIRVVFGGSPQTFILRHDVVCGFNSTSLFEALAAGCLHYAEALEAEMQPYRIDFEDAVEYADSPDMLEEILVRRAQERRQPSAELPDTRVRFLDKWLFNSDGQADLRVRKVVLAEIAGGENGQSSCER